MLYRWIVETQGEALDDALIARVVLQVHRSYHVKTASEWMEMDCSPLSCLVSLSRWRWMAISTPRRISRASSRGGYTFAPIFVVESLGRLDTSPPQDITQSLFASSETFHFREGIVFDLSTVYDTLLVAPCFLVSLSPSSVTRFSLSGPVCPARLLHF
ncbi:hypothetical protein POX_e07052 [Penicillium oxalicum]|uniref:Uncharacterized protein n=1 Tax=Penicillium oxalicum (strain 114-2 / CGMCC 5302) TaxID=933388 RepID=S7ZCS8_PENO1|nr:hypothetical protein POX_e07052 [Penicillium oxalicum]EPS28079.1 hypothetical protein PDE_03025 [Penicillium oxalicum 114-2]KAI2789026.1 hypothetical protein POX_e07052 [Penicillium oxalicum]